MRDLQEEVNRTFDRALHEVAAAMGATGRTAAGTGAVAPPPPPPPAPPSSRPVPPPPLKKTVWTALEEDRVDSTASIEPDPISAFAPAPVMDWGPKRPSLLDRRSSSRRPSGASI
jgi:hypothetical protein